MPSSVIGMGGRIAHPLAVEAWRNEVATLQNMQMKQDSPRKGIYLNTGNAAPSPAQKKQIVFWVTGRLGVTARPLVMASKTAHAPLSQVLMDQVQSIAKAIPKRLFLAILNIKSQHPQGAKQLQQKQLIVCSRRGQNIVGAVSLVELGNIDDPGPSLTLYMAVVHAGACWKKLINVLLVIVQVVQLLWIVSGVSGVHGVHALKVANSQDTG